MSWEKEIADELWELLPPDFQYKNVDRKTAYNWLRTRLESVFKQVLKSQMSDLRKEVEKKRRDRGDENRADCKACRMDDYECECRTYNQALDEVLLLMKAGEDK